MQASYLSPSLLKLIVVIAFHALFTNESLIILQTNNSISFPGSSNAENSNVTMFNSSATSQQQMLISQMFNFTSTPFYCSLNPKIYTYIPYKQNGRVTNDPYLINITVDKQNQLNNSTLEVTFWTNFTNMKPNIAQVSSTTQNMVLGQAKSCSPVSNESASLSCLYQIQNNCPQYTSRYTPNYYDLITVNVKGLQYLTNSTNQQPSSISLSFWVLCDKASTFQYGLLLQIIFCAFLLPIVAVYSKAWSMAGRGFRLTWWLVVIFNSILILGAGIAISPLKNSLKIILVAILALSWIFGLPSVWLCSNELLFLIKKATILRYKAIKFSEQIFVRIMDILSIFIAVGMLCAWFLSNGSKFNWILNDIIDICMVIAAIKIFKFTSLKQAVICFCITIIIQMVFVIFSMVQQNSYNTAVLNYSNNPFQFQMPTINYVYNQKCSWLPVTSLIYPGVLMSYMRRFDSSRNTNVYLITCVCMFLVGSLFWMILTVVSTDSWPYGFITQPATIGSVAFFAWRRKEIKTLWNGQFHDQQFAHSKEIHDISNTIAKQRQLTQIIYSPQLLAGLYINEQFANKQNNEMEENKNLQEEDKNQSKKLEVKNKIEMQQINLISKQQQQENRQARLSKFPQNFNKNDQ